MGFIEKAAIGLVKGAASLSANIGNAAIDVGKYAYNYVFKSGTAFRTSKLSGFGKTAAGISRGAGIGAVNIAGSIGRTGYSIAKGTVANIPSTTAGVVGTGIGLGHYAGTRALGIANTTGKAVSFMFKDDTVRDINNLWTGKKMRSGIGWSLVGGGAILGAMSGVSSTRTQEETGTVIKSSPPSMNYDGSSYRNLMNSASGDLTLSLHNLRRG